MSHLKLTLETEPNSSLVEHKHSQLLSHLSSPSHPSSFSGAGSLTGFWNSPTGLGWPASEPRRCLPSAGEGVCHQAQLFSVTSGIGNVPELVKTLRTDVSS